MMMEESDENVETVRLISLAQHEEEDNENEDQERDDSFSPFHVPSGPTILGTSRILRDPEKELLMMPLIMSETSPHTEYHHAATIPSTATATNTSAPSSSSSPPQDNSCTTTTTSSTTSSSMRSRRKKDEDEYEYDRNRRNRRRKRKKQQRRTNSQERSVVVDERRRCCPAPFVRSTLNVMNLLARILFWFSLVAMLAGVVWYSYELFHNGTDPHLIAWFSAGAFVLLGFPISMYGIVMHLANYNQPNVQCYIVRILWMIPMYSMESWLCLRFHRFAIYIETLRDVYESYVLYSFLQFLIQVLGGEDELVLMLKDKSPTRGVHMWGLQWCVRPWLMGQPASRTVYTQGTRPIKRVSWTSPFFVRCKFGVLQYVLLKCVSSIFVMILELNGLYKEGDFTPKGGYLYICILTNLSQCWALYCLILFYYATHNELSHIRPVGKFLSVKAIVFFTWWQSVCISLIYQMDMIPHYHPSSESEWTAEDVAKGLQDYLICIEMFIGAIVHTFVFPHTDYLAAAVAARRKASLKRTSKRRLGRLHNKTHYGWLYHHHHNEDDDVVGGDHTSICSKNSEHAACDVEMASQATDESLKDDMIPPMSPLQQHHHQRQQLEEVDEEQTTTTSFDDADDDEENHNNNYDDYDEEDDDEEEDDDNDGEECEEEDSQYSSAVMEAGGQGNFGTTTDTMGTSRGSHALTTQPRPGFVRALLDSTIPRDVFDNSVGIVKGEYVVEKKTLLNHATTSDQYDLFSNRKQFKKSKTAKEQA